MTSLQHELTFPPGEVPPEMVNHPTECVSIGFKDAEGNDFTRPVHTYYRSMVTNMDGSKTVTYDGLDEALDGAEYSPSSKSKTHRAWMRDTKALREAAAKAASDAARHHAELMARCGHGTHGRLSSVDMALYYLETLNFNSDYIRRAEIELEFLAKLAPMIEATVAQAFGFATWASFTDARDVLNAARDEAEAIGMKIA
jgi:hypothetical protein